MPAVRCEQCGTSSALECASFCHACGYALRRIAPVNPTPRRGNLYLVPAPTAVATADASSSSLGLRSGIAGLCTVLGAAGIGILVRIFAASSAAAWWVFGVLLIAGLLAVIATLVLLPRRAS